MSTKILKNPIEVNNRLEELGQTRERLVEVVEAMVGAKADCTDNDPPGSRGWSAYRMGTRRLREETLIVEGWVKDDTDQIASVLNKRLGIRIAVSNTDDGTGVDEEGVFPQNRSRKGAATDRAVQTNQGSFMDILDAAMKVVPLRPTAKTPGPIVTWYLCVYCEGDEYRAELSCPIDVDAGFFTGFVERIIIVGPGFGEGDPIRRRTDNDNDGSDFDIPVRRKK